MNEEPATNQQLLSLQEYGFVPERSLTLGEAARLLENYRKNPPASVAPESAFRHQQHLHGAGTAQSGSHPNSAANISHNVRAHVHELRRHVEGARVQLAETPDHPELQAAFNAALGDRREFWLDTCRDVKEMRVGSVLVFELYQNFGARFFTPTTDQVQEVLDALDRALAAWDRDHPELFFQTLELNFPMLLRQT